MNKAMFLIIGGLVATLAGVGTIEASITGNALLTGILLTASVETRLPENTRWPAQ